MGVEPFGELLERFTAVRDLVLLGLWHLCVSLSLILEASIPTCLSQPSCHKGLANTMFMY